MKTNNLSCNAIHPHLRLCIVYLFLLSVLIIPIKITAQVSEISISDQRQIEAELKRRNIKESELRERLKEKGVDINQIPPAELPQYESIIMQTLSELEEEKRRETAITHTVDTIEFLRHIPPKPDFGIIKEKDTLKKTKLSNIYGHNLFIEQNIEVFQTTEGARAPDTYVLGPGDQIRINIFGASQADLLLEINSEGYVRPDVTPQIYLKGLTIAQARNLLERRLSQFYTFRSNQFSLSIHTARTINVNIFGEANIQGSFNVSALNTAINAIAAAEGPTEIGSVRNIEHIRGNQRKKLDLYAFMNDPTIQFDFDLQHNDIIFIPTAKKIVNIQGSVKRPMRYELIEGESLKNLIEYAGGINFDTYPDFVQIERMEDGEIVLREWSLAEALRNEVIINLQDGDIVRLRQVQKPLERFVEIEGAVFYQGQYNLDQNPTLNILLEKAQLRPQAKTDIIFIERTQPDESIRIIPVAWDETSRYDKEVQLEPKDIILVFDHEKYRSLATISIIGEVRNPYERSLPFDERISIAHALSLAGGAKPTAAETAYVVRTDLMNPEIVKHIPVSIIQDWDFMLQPGDELRVYNQSTYTNIPQISIQGAINDPLTTRYEPHLTITDLIKMAGGFTEKAELSRIDIFRLIISPKEGTTFERINLEVDTNYNLTPQFSTFRLQPYDQVVVRQIPMFKLERTVQISGEVMFPGTYPLETRNMRLSELIQEAGGITNQADIRHATLMRSYENTGPVGIELDKALSTRRDERHDPIIIDDDVITIPKYHNTFSIRIKATRVGELESRKLIADETFIPDDQDDLITFIYQGPHSARWYINNFAGGFAEDADKWSVTVTKRNGRVIGTRRRMLLFRDYPRVTPGSTIALTHKPPEPEKEDSAVDWEKLFFLSTQAATTMVYILWMIDRMNN